MSALPQEESGGWLGGLKCLLRPGELRCWPSCRQPDSRMCALFLYIYIFISLQTVHFLDNRVTVCSPGPYKLAAYKRALAPSQGSLQLLTDPAWKVNLEETQMS